MKYKKGSRKTKSKRGHNESKAYRYGVVWLDGKCFVDPKRLPPALPKGKLKEKAKVIRDVFPESNELLNDGPVVQLSKEVEQAVTKLRHKAEVVPIGRNTDTRSSASPVILSDAEQISKLQALIDNNVPANNEESTLVGPVKPKLAEVHRITGDKATRKATPPIVHEQVDEAWVKLHGTCIRDTGEGMTPSGKPITDFLKGGRDELTYILEKVRLHSVTSSNDYSPDELAELYDMQQVEMHELRVKHDKRIAVLNDQVTDLTEALYQERDANKIKGFNDSHSSLNGEFEVAIVELQNDNSCLTLEKEELRKEVEHLAEIIDVQSIQLTSVRSKPPLKTLALQYQIYKKQHEDDSLRNFFRHSDYCMSQMGALRQYFDDACDLRIVVGKERQAYSKWGARTLELPHRETRQAYVKAKFERMMAPKRAMFKERSVYIGWGNRTTTPMCTKRIAYMQWWMDNLTPEDARHRALLTTKRAKVLKVGIQTYRNVRKVLTYELSPTKRKATEDQRKSKAIARRASIKKQKVKASGIKRMREQEYEQREQLNMIREAQRIAH